MTAPTIENGIVKYPVVSIKEIGRVLYALQPKQYQFFNMTPIGLDILGRRDVPFASHLGYGGAAGGGKSYVSRAILTAVALGWPGSTSIIFRSTDGEVVANHVEKFRAEVPEVIQGNRLYTITGRPRMARWYNDSKTYFGYLSLDDDVYTYQGPEYDVMIFEEATQYSFFQVSWLSGNRLRATVKGARPFAVFPSNPGGQGHFWYKRWFIERRFHESEGERPDDFAFHHAKLSDNQELMVRDPQYAIKLNSLPEPHRSWLRDGDFAAGAGTALDVRRDKHLIDPREFVRQPYWRVFGAFDWGFDHPFSFGFYAVDEDGHRICLDTVTGRRLLPDEIARRVKSRMTKLGIRKLSYIVAGHDCWAKKKAHGENTKTIAEQFADEELFLSQANIDRIMGVNELRRQLQYEDGEGKPREPMLMFVETDDNKKVFAQLETRVMDPNDSEDVLKTDADDWGEGGDDHYDQVRYGSASRVVASAKPDDERIPYHEQLRIEHEKRRHRSRRGGGPGGPMAEGIS